MCGRRRFSLCLSHVLHPNPRHRFLSLLNPHNVLYQNEQRPSTSKPFISRLGINYPRALHVLGSAPVALTSGPTPPSPFVIAGVVLGLPLALWTYKCLMMYVFQRKIIYMPYAPINARKDTLAEVPKQFTRGMEVEEVRVPSDGGGPLSGIACRSEKAEKEPEVVMVYFQGNAGNPLHRLPVFQTLLSSHSPSSPTPTILAVAPRGYWSSPGRPNQYGITADYRSVLYYALQRWPKAKIVVYGHSLGGAASVCLLNQLRDQSSSPTSPLQPAPAESTLPPISDYSRIQGLILENPFSSIPGMVRTLYPQKWLPYHWMAPFAWDQWDALGALRALRSRMDGGQSIRAAHEESEKIELIESNEQRSVLHCLAPDMLLLLSEHDEIVPREMGETMWDAVVDSPGKGDTTNVINPRPEPEIQKQEMRAKGRKVIIPHALHETAWQRAEWKREVRGYLESVVRGG